MKLKLQGVIILLIINIFLIIQGSPPAFSGEKAGTVVLIIMDRINLSDLKDCPNVQEIINNGAIGLMNIRAAGRYKGESSYLSIGAGVRASSLEGGKQVYQFGETVAGEKAEILYENITGEKPQEGNIMVLDFPRLIAENKGNNYDIVPGLLGETLQKNNIPVTLLGDGDTLQEKDRPGVLIAMDKRGIVQQGKIGGELSKKDIASPFLLKTDYDKLWNLFTNYYPQGGLIVIQLGDLLRADKFYGQFSSLRSLALRQKVIASADAFVGQVMEKINPAADLLMLITPFPSLQGYGNKNLLTPFIMAGKGISPGLTITDTTRRAGVLANIDVAPTILDYFGLEIPSIILGNPLSSIEAGKDNTYEIMAQLEKEITSTHIQRSYLIKPFVAVQIIISLGFLVLFFWRKEGLKYLKPLMVASMSFPVVLLYLPLLAAHSLVEKYSWLFFLTFIITVVLLLFTKTMEAVYLIGLFTGLSIQVDLFLGSPLMKASILGYDPIGGSRYYGLGNEYMGVFIGSLIIGTTSLLDKVKADKKGVFFAALLFASAFYLILSPRFGSNVGGTISAFGAFTLTLLLTFKIKVKIKHFFFLGGGLLITLLILFLVISQFAPPSHISKTVDLIKEGGISPLLAIFSRKLAMNYKLLRYTVWTRALLASLAVIAALLYRPPFLLQRIFSQNKYLHSGFIGTGIGCLLALIFNDSGIVAAATMMIFIALPVMLLVIDQTGTKVN